MQNTNKNIVNAPSAKMIRLGDGAYVQVFMNGESLTVRQSENPDAFDAALKALKANDWDVLYSAMRPVKSFVKKVGGVTIDANGVYFNGKQMHNALTRRIMEFAQNGLDHQPMCLFLGKLMDNPSSRAVEELYNFLEYQNLPITDNGNILAYKGVKNDWYSITSGKVTLLQGKEVGGCIYNGVGEVIEIPRNQVNDNADVGCSYGLHAGTLEYARDFGRGGRLVIVEINPADVVSIPKDCSHQKLRCSKYKVVGEYTAALDKPLYQSQWVDADTDSCYDEDSCCSTGGDCDGTCGSVPVEFEFETLNSDWIDNVVFYQNNELEINTLEGSSIVLQGVPRRVAEDFRDTVADGGSAGAYYHRWLRDKYTHR
jgi:hypothetical protein